MDGLNGPFVLTSLLLAHTRPRVSELALGIAFGIKFWPIILLPLLWRHLWGHWRQLASLFIIFAVLAVIGLWPQIFAGLDQKSGLIAYAPSWNRNGALIIALESLAGLIAGNDQVTDFAPLFARGLSTIAMVSTRFILSLRPIEGIHQLIARATLAAGALVLLSPAQYPWYSTWVAPLLALHPVSGLLLLPIVLPLYELYFFFNARGMNWIFPFYIVWLIWIPIWTTLFVVDGRFWWRKNLDEYGGRLRRWLN